MEHNYCENCTEHQCGGRIDGIPICGRCGYLINDAIGGKCNGCTGIYTNHTHCNFKLEEVIE